ncbi:hypothetical protein G6F56_001412 [Rhizopus delemar]|nr:hypothetical protein G6F56_001412 [Rhizopus delemar]
MTNSRLVYGKVNLSNLKLRKDALDKLDLPLSVSEGYIGDIKLVIPWSNLKSEPVKVIIDDIYLLAEPKNEKNFSVEEEEERLFHLKQQRLAQAEVLDSSQEDTKTNDGFLAQLTTKVINNLQFQIKNIHIRYEDNISDPGHPFAVGVALKELSGLSTDDEWQPKFISDPTSPINKLVTLESLSLYWNTDTKSLAGQHEQDVNVFTNLIPTRHHSPKHQFLLKPVSGTARVTLNQTDHKPKTEATLLFDEIAFGLDENQYRDCILMLDLFQANIKKQKYLKFHPAADQTVQKNPRVFFQFAAQAVLSEIHERNYKWSWDHFRKRRDQRVSYVECYMASQLKKATEKQAKDLEELEHALSFQDIRFYRSIAHVNLRKQKVQIEIETQKKKAENAKKSWWGWATGASSQSTEDEPIQMTEEQKKEFYEAIEYDEDKINVSATSNLPKDSIKLAVKTNLQRGSFTLKKKEQELLSLVFDSVSADFTQYVESVKVGAALGDLQLFDGSQKTIYPQLVGVKTEGLSLLDSKYNQDLERRKPSLDHTSEPFFSAVFEKNPLNNKASNAIRLKTRPLEIIYSPVLIASATEFFKPPSSKMEGVNAVMAAAENRLERLKHHSRASLEFAFEKHTTFDVDVHIDAPILYIPESLTVNDSPVLMINPGHIKVDSELADTNMVEEIKTKEIQSYNQEDVQNLERLMYDKFNVKLTETKIMIGSVQECLGHQPYDAFDPCFIDHLDMQFSIELCILPESTQFTKAKVSGYLPLLSINMSDDKYKMLMKIVDAASPKSDSPPAETSPVLRTNQSQSELVLDDTENKLVEQVSEIELFKFNFQIDKLSILLCESSVVSDQKKDQALCEIVLEGFGLAVVGKSLDFSVDLSLQALNVLDKMEHGAEFNYLLTSGDSTTSKRLLGVSYKKASREHPEFSSVYDGYDQSVDLSLSTFTVIVTRSSLLYLQHWASKTFVSSSSKPDIKETQVAQPKESKTRTKVGLHLDSAHVMLNNDGSRLATLGLHSGDLLVLLEPKTMQVNGKFGNLTLSDDAAHSDAIEKFIVSIQGDALADFSFQTFSDHADYDQAFKLRMGAIRIVVSSTLQPIMHFMTEFLEMKSIYDNAKSTAQETQVSSRFHYDVLIHSPLVVLPADGKDTITAYLGEIRAKNEFESGGAHIECGLYKINVQSMIANESLQVLQDLDIAVTVDSLDEQQQKVRGSISDVLMSLTEGQYKALLQVSDNLQKTFASSSPKTIGLGDESVSESVSKPIDEPVKIKTDDSVTKLDLLFELKTICLEVKKDSVESLSRLAFHSIVVKMQTQSDESMKMEGQLQSIEFSDTRKESKSKFREILPAQSLNGPQFDFKLHSYKQNNTPVMDMHAAIDSPKIILSLDYLLLLKDFFTAPLAKTKVTTNTQMAKEETPKTLNFNVSIVQFEIICLATPELESSEAVVLSFGQLKAKQQDVMGLDLDGIQMSLCRMNTREESTVQVIEPLDISLLVNQTEGMSVNVQVKPVILRLSYQDAMLITTIVNKALAFTPQSGPGSESDSSERKFDVSKESLIASFEGLQIILIEDLHELPFIDFYLEPFELMASDWSKSVEAHVDCCLGIKNFNFKNSHWEPLLEPWKFAINASQDPTDKNTRLSLDSKDFIYLNLTHTFIESALVISQTLSEIKTLADSAHVQVKPYEIVNATGYPLSFWNMSDDMDSGYTQVHRLQDGQSLAWNFRDTKDRGTNVNRNLLGLQIEENGWESILHVDVDRERELSYRLRPEDNNMHLVVDVRLQKHVKKVTLRSGLVLQNNSSQDMELTLADSSLGVIRLESQQTYSVPIKLCYHPVVVRPSDQYQWSQPIVWSNIPPLVQSSPLDHSSGVYLFQTQVQPSSTRFPHLNVQFCAPLEIENLLPFDFDLALVDTSQRLSLSLQQGAKKHVHIFNSNAVLNMQLDLKSDEYQPSQVTTIKTHAGYNEMSEKLVIQDQQGTPVHLRMHVSRTTSPTNSLYVGIYAPYLVLNKSSFPIQLRSQQTFRQAKAQMIPAYQTGQIIQPAVFSYADVSTRNRAQLSIDGIKWSEPVSFEAVGNSQGAALLSKADNLTKHTGIKIEEGKGPLRLTKIVTIAPRYILKNNMRSVLRLCEFGTEESLCLQPGETTAFYQTTSSQLRWVSLAEKNGPWSAPVNIQDIGKMYVKLDSKLLLVSVSVKDATLFSTFSEDDEWPYQIVNHSSLDLQLTQSQIDFDNSQLKSSQKKILSKPASFTVRSQETLDYAWDVPVAKEKRLELCVGNKRRAIHFEAVGSQVPFKTSQGSLSMDVVARGSRLVLQITDFDASSSLYRSKSSEESFETILVQDKIKSVLQINLAGLRLSMVDRYSRELALATVKRFEFKYTDSKMYQSLRLSVEWIQIDNQSFGSAYPILCYPSARPKVSNEQTTHPTLHVALDKVKDEQHGVNYFKIFSFLMQELTLEVDESFLYALMDFTQFDIESKPIQQTFLMEIQEPAVEKESALYYFEEFCIQPMRLNLSFGRDDQTPAKTQNLLMNSPIGYILNVLTMTIGNVNDAPIKLNALMVDNLRATLEDLSLRMALHYREQAMYQVHRVLGSIDLLGNPVGLFNNLSSGFGELFYEPYQGFIMSDRPQDMGMGVAKGVGGFMKKSVFGVSDSVSKLTGSLGKGLSAATMDKRFQEKRRTNTRNRPTHAVGGVTQGVGYFGASLASGITGLVTNPMEGASENGAVGFVGGIGKGLVGAITKPVAGLFDMTSNITAGIRETATSDGKVILRERLPRFIGQDGILIPYSQREALGQLWLKEVNDGHFFNDAYVAHGLLESEKEAVILTHERIIVMRSDHLKMAAHIPLEAIDSVDAREDRVCLTVKKGKAQTFKFDKDTNGDWFAKKIVETLQEKLTQNNM